MKATGKLIIFIFTLLALAASAYAQTPRDQLNQMTEQLQKNPDDNALRENIIKLALTLNPKPNTSDAVSMAEGAAEYAFKNAKSNSDFSDAAKQYEKALLLAPWLADDYFNCGVAHEKAGENKEAIRSFNLYLLAAPDATDSKIIKKRIGGLQYAIQKAIDDANKTVNKEMAVSAPVIQVFHCRPSIPQAYKQNISFDFSTRMVTSRLVNPDLSDAGPFGSSVSFQEVGTRLIWTIPSYDHSVANGTQVSLDRDTGVVDATMNGQLFPRTQQCSTNHW